MYHYKNGLNRFYIIAFIILFSITNTKCSEEKGYFNIEAKIVKIEWVKYSFGFSKGGAKIYYKQRIYIRYKYRNSIYNSEFISDKKFGLFHKIDFVLIKINMDKPSQYKVLGKKIIRPRLKNKQVKASSNTPAR